MKHLFEIYQINKRLSATRLSIVQFLLLDFISTNGNVTCTKLAQYLGISSAGMTAHIDELEKALNVERIHSKIDRRQILLKITDKGMSSLGLWRKTFVDAMRA